MSWHSCGGQRATCRSQFCCGFLELNSGHQAWWQVLSHLTIFFKKKIMEPNGVDPTSNCSEVGFCRMGVVFSSSIK